ncbi:hypothetical protein L9F63_006005, partial [Diploptera punctata]
SVCIVVIQLALFNHHPKSGTFELPQENFRDSGIFSKKQDFSGKIGTNEHPIVGFKCPLRKGRMLEHYSLLKLLPITSELIHQECIYACIPQIIPLYQIPLLRVYRKHDRSLQGPTSWINLPPQVAYKFNQLLSHEQISDLYSNCFQSLLNSLQLLSLEQIFEYAIT